jgi:hypothetical protein
MADKTLEELTSEVRAIEEAAHVEMSRDVVMRLANARRELTNRQANDRGSKKVDALLARLHKVYAAEVR